MYEWRLHGRRPAIVPVSVAVSAAQQFMKSADALPNIVEWITAP
jgi:hypothetical protein